MAEQQFLKGIAFSNLAGSSFTNFVKLISKHGFDRKFLFRVLLNGLISFVLSILAIGDKLVWLLVRKKLRRVQPPLFILGHWRSGTTHLHNLLCLDDRAVFSTTYQTVFPNLLFGFHRPLLWLMRVVMPKTRPVDHVELDARKPQEEEFGLGNVMEMSYYNWWYFPAHWQYFQDHFLSMKSLSEKDRERWKKTYETYIRRAVIRESNFWFISKNPPNTARIEILLEQFPHARFVFIQRNPYEVFISSKNFFKAIMEPLQLQSITDEEFDKKILRAYCTLYDEYQKQKELIPKNRLFELRYEGFMQNELKVLPLLYRHLEIVPTKQVINSWKKAVGNKTHKNKTYNFDPETIKLVNETLGNRIEQMGYERLTAN